jgi:hypothetical protein
MTRNYYYFVTALPELLLDSGKTNPLLDSIFAEAVEVLHPDDLAILKLIRLPFDNKNIIALLEKRSDTFDTRGIFSKQALELELKNPDELPPYIETFIAGFRASKPLGPDLGWEDQLQSLFYAQVTGHSNSFISAWFTFEQDLRNVVAGLQNRRLQHNGSTGGELKTVIIGHNEVAESILRSSATDFALAGKLPWIEKVIAAVNGSDIVRLEQTLDTLRWEMLDELTAGAYFSIEVIAAFFIRLCMAVRWQTLDSATGQVYFDRLVATLMQTTRN